jgi:hypothetical protein
MTVTYCSFKARPSAYSGDQGAMCHAPATHYCRLEMGEWAERCAQHSEERDVVQVVRKRGLET